MAYDNAITANSVVWLASELRSNPAVLNDLDAPDLETIWRALNRRFDIPSHLAHRLAVELRKEPNELFGSLDEELDPEDVATISRALDPDEYDPRMIRTRGPNHE